MDDYAIDRIRGELVELNENLSALLALKVIELKIKHAYIPSNKINEIVERFI